MVPPTVQFDLALTEFMNIDDVAGLRTGSDPSGSLWVVFQSASPGFPGAFIGAGNSTPLSTQKEEFSSDANIGMFFTYSRTDDAGTNANYTGQNNDTNPHTFTYALNAGNLDAYMDAVFINSPGSDVSAPGVCTFDQCGLGCLKQSVFSRFFRGRIAELAMWNRALTLGEILALESYATLRYGI